MEKTPFKEADMQAAIALLKEEVKSTLNRYKGSGHIHICIVFGKTDKRLTAVFNKDAVLDTTLADTSTVLPKVASAYIENNGELDKLLAEPENREIGYAFTTELGGIDIFTHGCTLAINNITAAAILRCIKECLTAAETNIQVQPVKREIARARMA